MEVSSHALDQRRAAGITFRAGVFTNATPEHLDYHKTFEAYREAKAMLFELVAPSGTAVLNADDPAFEFMRSRVKTQVLTFGLDAPADVRVVDWRCTLRGSSGTLVTPAGHTVFHTTLMGCHNLSNLAAMAAVGIAEVVPVATMVEALATFPGVPGRLEPVEAGQPFPVLVDYAHTDDALRNVLQAMRAMTDARLIVVFGCGGDRDRAKRPRMGAVASQWAHHVIVTSDNPRSEWPEEIAEAVVSGIVPGASYQVILDRASAIRAAIQQADSRCVVLVAGKGHEKTQVFRDRTVPFDDVQVVRDALVAQGVVG